MQTFLMEQRIKMMDMIVLYLSDTEDNTKCLLKFGSCHIYDLRYLVLINLINYNHRSLESHKII